MYFVKTNAAGNIQWSKTLGISGYDHANAVILTSDGGYAVAGSTGGNNSHMVLLKLTAAGDVQWIRYFSANTRQSGSSLVQTPDGSYAIAGQVSTYNNGSWGYLVRTDSLGTLLWSKRIFDRGFYPEILDICNTYDGGLVLAAITPTPAYYDMCLIKLGANGSFQWARSIGGSSTDIPSFVKQTSDSGYIMAQNRLQVQLTADNQTPAFAAINIFSADGKLIINKMYDIKKGDNVISIQVGTLKPGLYILQFSSVKDQKTIKFIKQ